MVPRHCRPGDAPPYPPGGHRRRPRSYPIPPGAVAGVLGRSRGAHGVVLVEFALVIGLLLFVTLGIAEIAMLGSAKLTQDAATVEAARWAVINPDEPATGGADLLGLTDCLVESEDGAIVTVSATCQYRPVALRGFFGDGIPVSSTASAVRYPEPTPEPTP
jgi:hypothetical protein